MILCHGKKKQIKWHESCNCECRLDPVICKNWNKEKCRYKCLVNKKCDNKLFVWNPNNRKCEKKEN